MLFFFLVERIIFGRDLMNKKATKNFRVFALILLTSALLLLSIAPNIASVKAQAQATVVVTSVPGGTTDPSGTNTYADGTGVVLTATANDGFLFQAWDIETSAGGNFVTDNPYTLNVSASVGTYTVNAVFAEIQFITPANPSTANNAVIVVVAGVGGTVSPAPGTYAVANAATLQLTATPNSGWLFHNWIISGTATNTGHGGYPENLNPIDNPYTVGHGYGYTFYYQPYFVPVGSSVTSPTPTTSPVSTTMGLSTDAWIIVALAVILVIVIIAFGVFAATRRSKK
jgi:hypothetical protein